VTKGIIKLQRQRVAVANGLAESWSLEAGSQGLQGSWCWWHRQVSGTAWSLGRLLPTFVPHKGSTRV